MAFQLSDEEAEALRYLPVGDLAALAAELGFMPPEAIDRRQMLGELVPRLFELAQDRGLPFSKYDAEDLEELPPEHRRALAEAMGWGKAVMNMVKAGEKVYRSYRKRGHNSQVTLLLPSLLKPLARYASERGST